MGIKAECYAMGFMGTNCYLITDEATGKSAVVDPGGVSDALDEAIRKAGAEQFEYILLTHGHFDHIGGVCYYRNLLHASVAIHEKDADFTSNGGLSLASMYMRTPLQPFKPDIRLKDGEELTLGETRIRVLHTPGHTCGSCCFVLDDMLFSGDTLMRQSIGRTDFPTGSYDDIRASLKKLSQLEGDYRIYPGHGDFTTLQYERENNPYLGMVENDAVY